jgi:hypothetical protein
LEWRAAAPPMPRSPPTKIGTPPRYRHLRPPVRSAGRASAAAAGGSAEFATWAPNAQRGEDLGDWADAAHLARR